MPKRGRYKGGQELRALGFLKIPHGLWFFALRGGRYVAIESFRAPWA